MVSGCKTGYGWKHCIWTLYSNAANCHRNKQFRPPNSTMRSSNGCWTCRVRRKKCDETPDICANRAALDITCCFDLDQQPEWMDGGVRQDRMAEQLKNEVKAKSYHRSDSHHLGRSSEQVSQAPAYSIRSGEPLETSSKRPSTSRHDTVSRASSACNSVVNSSPQPILVGQQEGVDCTLINNEVRSNIAYASLMLF